MYIIKNSSNQTYKNNIIFTALTLWLLINIVLFPTTAINGATRGLSTWFNIVVPSLLPFFIISELLIRLGFVKFIGSLLEPVMMPIFNVPGIGAFPFSLSLVSGYPIGVKLVSSLRQKNHLSKIEAERLLSFSSTSGPLFMLGAVSVGMLKSSSLGPLIVYPHYLAAFSLGLLFKYYKKNMYISDINLDNNINSKPQESNYYLSAGQLLSNSIKDATKSIVAIGGFMVLYSVIIEILYISKFFNLFVEFITYILPFNISSDVIKGFFSGIIEITIGCRNIASTNLPTIQKLFIINFLIGWSGISIHSQALSFLAETDINSKLYILSKLFHGLLSTFFTFILYSIFYKNTIIETYSKEILVLKTTTFSQWLRLSIISIQSYISILIGITISAIVVTTIENIIKK